MAAAAGARARGIETDAAQASRHEVTAMCGVFGFVAAAPRSIDAAMSTLDIGMARIRHRGPDGSGHWVSEDGRVGLGHLRLSIIDLETGAQPMRTADDQPTIIYNGEIYNYIELRDEIGAHLFRTTSDTEVILRAYQKWGEDCVDHLRGMFAFA